MESYHCPICSIEDRSEHIIFPGFKKDWPEEFKKATEYIGEKKARSLYNEFAKLCEQSTIDEKNDFTEDLGLHSEISVLSALALSIIKQTPFETSILPVADRMDKSKIITRANNKQRVYDKVAIDLVKYYPLFSENDKPIIIHQQKKEQTNLLIAC